MKNLLEIIVSKGVIIDFAADLAFRKLIALLLKFLLVKLNQQVLKLNQEHYETQPKSKIRVPQNKITQKLANIENPSRQAPKN